MCQTDVILWSVPGFEPRALGRVAQIVTGQYTEYSDKNCTLRLDVYTSTYTTSSMLIPVGGNEYKYTCCYVRDVWSTQTFTVGSLPGLQLLRGHK